MIEETLLFFENTQKCNQCKSMLDQNKKVSKQIQLQKVDFFF